jgi:hypothetical protein
MRNFKKLKKDEAGFSKIIVILAVVAVMIIAGLAVVFMLSNDNSDGMNMEFGVTIQDELTGQSATGQVSMEMMSPWEMLSTLSSSRTVTLPALFTAEQLAAFSTNINGIVINRNYVVIPFIVMKATTTISTYYAATGTASASFTGTTNPAYTIYDFANAANSKTITAPSKSITMNGASVTINPTNLAESVRFAEVISYQSVAHPLQGTFLTEAIIHAKASATFNNVNAAPETKSTTADLTIHLVNPTSGTFSITVTSFGTAQS